MNGQLNSLEGFDSGSNYRFGDKMKINNNPRSLFDLSHLNTLTMNNAGLLIPIALWETLPSDDFDINVDCLLRVLPSVVPLYSRQRMYIYGFYSRYSDLWNNWQVFMDKGYTGNVEKYIPHFHVSGSKNIDFESGEKIVADSLFDYLGLPIGVGMYNISNANISMLPFMMYLRIYRDYFMNKNHWINDRVMLPDDDSRFRVNDDGQLLSAVDESKTIKFMQKNDITYDSEHSVYEIGLMYHDYADDYFTSALPFTQRGTAAKLNWNVDVSDITATTSLSLNDMQFSKAFKNTESFPMYYSGAEHLGFYYTTYAGGDKIPFAIPVTNPSDPSTNQNDIFNNAMKTQIGKMSATTTLSGDSLSLGITLEDIRKLAVEQQELEQLARTDGSYRQFGLSFFGETSKAAYDFRPTYIGGTYKNIVFTEVLQTSGSSIPTTGESASPLGAYSGHGITGISNGRIGHVHCDDYGMIMLIACIMPDVYYSQGLDRIYSDSIQSEKFLPERAKLGMQPIYNKEIYYAGNNGNSEGEDNYLWAYQNPFDYLRYIPNHIHGKIADPNNESFYPYTQARHFTQLPNWGRSFSNASNVRKDYLYSNEEDAYSAQFSINIRAVRPLPYKAIPAELVH